MAHRKKIYQDLNTQLLGMESLVSTGVVIFMGVGDNKMMSGLLLF